MPRIILGPKELRFELDMAVRKFGRSIDRDLNHRTNEVRQDVTLRIIVDAIAQRLDKLEVVRVVPDDLIAAGILPKPRAEPDDGGRR
jgi:hypothetical protein